MTAGALLLLLLAAPAALAQETADSSAYARSQGWFSRDKGLHFGVSAAAAGGLYAAGVEGGIRRPYAAAASAALVGAAGLWREIGTTEPGNLITREYLSGKDLVWDAVGIAAGLAITEAYYRARDRRRARVERAAVPAVARAAP